MNVGRRLFDACLFGLANFILSLRYRIKVTGAKDVAKDGRSGILFLPTHPALIDPVILVAKLFSRFQPRALADKDAIDYFFIRWVTRHIGVIPIGSLTKQAGTTEGVHESINACAEALNAGDNVIFYPAGKLLRSSKESLGVNSGLPMLLSKAPDARVVLIRSRGIWGSAFSWASGYAPDLPSVMKGAFKYLFINLIFFLPRRQVTLEVVEPIDFPRDASREDINTHLEAFYNATPNPNTFVPFTHFDREGTRELPDPEVFGPVGDIDAIPPATSELVRGFLTDLTSVETFDASSQLAADLGMDSIAYMELAGWLQDEFGSTPEDLEAFQTVGDVMLAAAGHAISAGPARLNDIPHKWWKCSTDPDCPDNLPDMTVPQAIFAQARRDPSLPILADQRAGVRTYRDLVMRSRLLSKYIAPLPGDTIGIILPSSVAAATTILATQLSGKTPAMINWTVGARNIEHCLSLAGVEKILTSRMLLDKLTRQGVSLDELTDRLIFLEDLGKTISKASVLRAAIGSHLPGAFRMPRTPISDTAVILFTSGSESLPKAVPLTHRNVLTNVADVWTCFSADRTDSMLGILPPFHSFGLTTSVFLTLIIGLRTVYHPDPTDSATLGSIIDAYKATIFASTPTFLSGILRSTPDEKLAPLRLVVSGAEKCPERLYAALDAQCPGTIVLEGYGATECAPVISVNRESNPTAGTIGPVVPSLDYAIVDPDSLARVDAGLRGMLLVTGDSVFPGYLNHDGASPFVEFEGRSWYRTGDLVTVDEEGVLTFAGRLKRFVKIGGEMISLPAIEGVLLAAFASEDDDGPSIAVTDVGEEGSEEIVLFTTRELRREDVNSAIRSAGLSGLHNVRRVHRMDALPLLGTGKVDYRTLKCLPTA